MASRHAPSGKTRSPGADQSWFFLLLGGIVVGGWALFWAGQRLVGNALSFNPLALISDVLGRSTDSTDSTPGQGGTGGSAGTDGAEGTVDVFGSQGGDAVPDWVENTPAPQPDNTAGASPESGGSGAGEALVSIPGVIVSLVLLGLIIAAVTVILGLRAKKKATRKGAAVVDATKHMATRRQIEALSRKAVAATTARTNPQLPDAALPGQLLGTELGTGKEVWLDYETLTVDMHAARYGKTTGRVLPMVLQAPGGVIATANKPDLVNDSLVARQAVGQCLVCDPQRIWMDPEDKPGFYVDILDFIRRRPADEWDDAAKALAILFANNAGVDIGTGGAGEEWRTSGAQLLSCFLLAATLSGRPVTEIENWVYDQSNREAIAILRDHDFPSMALQAQGSYDLTEKTRSGVFFSIQYMTEPLLKKTFQRWITPSAGVPKFDPSAFVKSHEAGEAPTLYLLSNAGQGGTGALLVLVLVAWLTEAGQYEARRNGGRLRIPLFFCLDEVANIVKWGGLAEAYSHFGSQGLILSSIFQTFEQGKRIFGASKASDMSSNATLVVGGGIKDKEGLEQIVSFVGEYTHTQVSVSSDSSSFKTSSSFSERDRAILTVADLRNLEPRLMVVIPQKSAPMIVEAIPFWQRSLSAPMAAAVAQSGALEAARERALRVGAAEEAGRAGGADAGAHPVAQR